MVRTKQQATPSMATETQRGNRQGYRPMHAEARRVLAEAEARIGKPLAEIEDHSNGCVPFTVMEDGSLRVLVSLCKSSTGVGTWGFPKGHPDEGESEIQGAIREVFEEVGIQLDESSIDSAAKADNKYSQVNRLHKDAWKKHKDYPDVAKRPVVITHKTDRYFLAVVKDRNLRLQEEEVEAAEWLTIDEALDRLTFDGEKNVLRHLLDCIPGKLRLPRDALRRLQEAYGRYQAGGPQVDLPMDTKQRATQDLAEQPSKSRRRTRSATEGSVTEAPENARASTVRRHRTH